MLSLIHIYDYIYVIKQHGFEEVNTDYTTDGHTVWKAVSYTHLDVYKRQALFTDVSENAAQSVVRHFQSRCPLL